MTAITLLLTLAAHAYALVLFDASAHERSSMFGLVNKPPTKPIPGHSPLQQCDLTESQSLQIQHVDMDPNPPERGHNLTINSTAMLDTTLEDGAYVEVEVRFGYIKLLSHVFDICDELEENNVGIKCPVQPGTYVLEQFAHIPEQVPPGKYKVTARAYNYDDEPITCITGDVVFPPLLSK